MDNNQQPKQPQLQLELNPQVTKTSYSNLAIISHSRSEFIIDFAATLPGLPKALIGDRIIMPLSKFNIYSYILFRHNK